MSYQTIYQNTFDIYFQQRVTAACAQEGADDPQVAATDIMWKVTSASDVEAAYASAVAGGNPNPGGDPAVIPDSMILSKVQAALAPAS